MERDKLCLKQKTGTKLLAFNLKKSLDEMIQFCENVGGKVAVARDEERQAEIRAVFQSGCEQNTDILHSGYSDQVKIKTLGLTK